MIKLLFIGILFYFNNMNTQDCVVDVNTKEITQACIVGEDEEILKIKSTCDLFYTQIQVYNRWANIVFEEINSNHGFDGTWKGHTLPDGEYAYIIKYKVHAESNMNQVQGMFSIRR